jgi:hypothetical protein
MISCWGKLLCSNIRERLPQALLDQGIDYALKRWEALDRFEFVALLDIDTNFLRNSTRPTAFGE